VLRDRVGRRRPGITYIVATGFGKALSFEHIYPTIVSTKH